MGVTPAYLISSKNLGAFLDAVRGARAPERFTLRFLESLGFTSTNDRLFVPLLKALRFIDDNSVPTKRYFEFLDETRSKQVLADGIRDAYEDLFRLNRKANALSRAEVTGKLKSLTEGKKSEKVIELMTKTFAELVKRADFSAVAPEQPVPSKETKLEGVPAESEGKGPEGKLRVIHKAEGHRAGLIDAVTYRIEVVLPAVRDQAVYDAIFRSLREHLL